MTPERWQQIRSIFENALEHPPTERHAFVQTACQGDVELQREVVAMLAACDSGSDFWETPPRQLAAEALAAQLTSTLKVGQQLGHYEINSLLGKGGMGEVYLAQDQQLPRKVALKVLPSEFTADAERLHRFKQEGLAVSALNHPNIVTLYELGQVDDAYFLATEFVAGQTLRQHLSEARLPLREVLEVTVQTASALAAAHGAGILHRDIKPENLMLRPDGYVKVLDFGLAKLLRDEGGGTRDESEKEGLIHPSSLRPHPSIHPSSLIPHPSTLPGFVMGTSHYMSPEQARGLKLDERTDIFSLGVVLYEMLTGQSPFAGATTADVIAAILEREPEPLLQHCADCPPALQDIVNRALRKDRAERYQTMQALLDDLQEVKEALLVEARLSNSRPRATVSRRAFTSNAHHLLRRRAVWLTLLGIVALSAAAYWTYNQRHREASIEAIAVLPFANGSENPTLDYLSDGLTESLIDRLARLPQLKVIARGSSFRFKGQDAALGEIAQTLGVGAVVTGRVTQRGERLVVRAELVDTHSQAQLWSETYERQSADLLLVQTEISAMLAEKLRLRLTAGHQQQLAYRETANPQAYEMLLQGRFQANQGGNENQLKAGEYFRQAIALDSSYALPYVELAFTYRSLMTRNNLDTKELTAQAEAAVRRALILDERLPEAHAALAEIQRNAWNWDMAEQEFKRALELNPNYARAHGGYAMFLAMRGRAEQAIAEINRACELDPLSLQINNTRVSVLYFARRHDEALVAARKLLELDPRYTHAHIQRGYNYAAKRQYAEAIAVYQEGIKQGSNNAGAQIYLGAAYALSGAREMAQTLLQQLNAGQQYVSPGELAILYAALGDRDQAFAALERAYAAHDLQLQFLGADPAFDSLRADPRFTEMLQRIGLT